MFLEPAFCQFVKDRVAGQVDMEVVDEADLDTEIQLAWERVESEGHRAVDRDNWSHTLRVSLSDGTLQRRIKLGGLALAFSSRVGVSGTALTFQPHNRRDVIGSLRTLTNEILDLTDRQVRAVLAKKQ
jgi:hypothetical protein